MDGKNKQNSERVEKLNRIMASILTFAHGLGGSSDTDQKALGFNGTPE